MRVRLTPPAAQLVRLSAEKEQRSIPKQASILILRGADKDKLKTKSQSVLLR